ncbi:MAG TPA: glycosyltransferase, partial [Cyclobacteriaceae bacterium]|nr:glycosyltransferase [Cyclobacteriaceae bacterium]
MSDKKPYRFILSGGGTGGHIYPAIAVADKAKELYPGSEILFVGANGKMEMEKVPQAGYSIVGLPVAGLHRKFTLRNLEFPFRLAASISKAGKIISDFKPDAVAGFGGYASAPVLWVA